MVIFPFEQLPYFQNWAFRERFLAPEECDRVLAMMNTQPLQDVVLRTEDPLAPPAEVRKSRAALLPWIKEAEWLFQRLTAAVQECNKAMYNFHLTGLAEALQFDQYPAGSFFDWHQDFGHREHSIRKLSVIVQLTDSAQYQGGDVELFSGRGPQKGTRSRGALLIFPSFIPCRILPVTAGTRTALSGWVAGSPFR